MAKGTEDTHPSARTSGSTQRPVSPSVGPVPPAGRCSNPLVRSPLLSGNQLIPHGGMVGESGQDDGVDLQVLGEHVVEGVHVQMPRPGPVVDAVLNKLEAWELIGSQLGKGPSKQVKISEWM